MALKQAKNALRRELKSKLAAMTEEQRAAQSNMITEKVMILYFNCDVIKSLFSFDP